MRTLLVPAAGRSSRYPDLRPKWVLTHPTGKLMIDMVLEAMDYRQFDRTVITVIKKHCEQHHVDVMFCDRSLVTQSISWSLKTKRVRPLRRFFSRSSRPRLKAM